ncbi:hypothetical protein [Enterococcus mundtii]|uniref:Uncharacterized protein n=1 Tax=Enterococcus mundtii TaxID=53346 RepID=A0A2M9FNV1_ENTMU|nr:hypothetical protein [Enterococcus mundtii]MRI74366.1 hypothetical protein [Enterococcus mundtii]NMP58166.1 hypothetical protein [Enterococcus mundtii]PJK25132.1 hypothetical protein CV769_12190 [Enterococcus mundtii]UBM06153.1 hypothetical protein K9N66_03090 [Enterococcus mundtii]
MRNRTNKQLVIGMAVLISLVMIGIGGKVYMDNREERKAQELLAVEKQSVRVLKNTFADIAEIKFEGSAKNDMTGSYRLFVTMKNLKGQSVYFSYGFWKESNKLGELGVEDRAIQIKGITKNKIRVIYTSEEEEEI